MTRRSYLPSDARHDDLLDAADRLFERGGVAAVTMVALAKEAGVSRALVYQHFADLTALFTDFFERRADRFFERASSQQGPADTPLVNAFRGLSELPDLDLRGMNLLLSDYPDPELAPIRDRVRDRFVERWTPFLPPDRDLAASRAVLWSAVQATLSLAIAVKRDEVPLEVAVHMWMTMLGAMAEAIPPAG